MTIKSQIAALAAATSLGVAGGALAVKTAEPTPQYRVHAMDLRRTPPLSDGGFEVKAEVWADKSLSDGGWKDLSRGSPCDLGTGYQTVEKDLLKAAEACVRE